MSRAAEVTAALGVAGVDDVLAEINKAVAKFPTWPTDPLHAVAVLGEEYGELVKAVLQLTYEPHKTTAEEVRMEAIQTAAMALRFLQSLPVYRYQPGEQHKQTAALASPTSPPAQEGKPRCICKGIASLRECPVHGWAPNDIRSRRDAAPTPPSEKERVNALPYCTYPKCECALSWNGDGGVPATVCPKEPPAQERERLGDETPRTDSHSFEATVGDAGKWRVVSVSVAKQLERELNAALRQADASVGWEELIAQWRGYFDDIEDDARVLLPHAPEKLHGAIEGIRIVAGQGKTSIDAAIKREASHAR